MLAVSPVRSSNGDGRELETVGFTCEGALLEDINFDELFMGFDEGDILPDLEVDPAEIFAEFSASGEEDSANTAPNPSASSELEVPVVQEVQEVISNNNEKDHHHDVKPAGTCKPNRKSTSSSSSSPTKGSQGKRKVKVDWTPELHRRFVQAVEQLGVDKAVPSRILEIMGIDCLTRHNIASHLQKYRSHRKHLLAREAEAASWSQRRQMYAGGGGGGGGGGLARRPEMSPWFAPTMGFPPAPPVQLFRPLHVWGHPTVDQPMLHVWPRTPSPQPLLHPPPDPSFWHPHFPRNAMTQGTPCYPPQPIRFAAAPAVSGLYRPLNVIAPAGKQQPGSQTHPSKESIDAAIGDVLTKPWSPLPLGLKPPSVDSVLVELQRQGISKVPPTCG
ncbi:putative transcription factor MYB-HB-like family [Dioscorea sansibarensis]